MLFFFTAIMGNKYSSGIRPLISYWELNAINMEMCSKQGESQTVQELVTLVHWKPGSGGDRQAEKTQRTEQEEKE